MVQEKLLTVNNLRTEFFSSKKSSVTAINEISFHIDKGEILGLVGESGCGKSVTSLSIMRLLNFTSGKVTNYTYIYYRICSSCRKRRCAPSAAAR